MAVPPTHGSSPRSHDSLEGSPIDPSSFISYPNSEILRTLFAVMRNSHDSETKEIGQRGLEGKVTVSQLQAIEVLNLSSCNLSELPPNIHFITGLVELNLMNNQLREIPETFSALTNLRILNLQKNNLESFPPVITKLAQLGVLYLRENPLKEVPIAVKDVLRSFPDQAKWVN